MGSPDTASLRIAVIGGGPAGSLFALYALRFAELAGREVAITIYEGKEFRNFGQPGCNMCAGIVPASVLCQLADLDISIPPRLILSHISSYALHTSAGTLRASQPDPNADIISVYRGAGPRYGHPPDQLSFDELLIQTALECGASLRQAFVESIRRGRPSEVVAGGETERYDLVVLATGVNGPPIALDRSDYRPPPLGSMCQTEVYLGQEEVQRRLGSSVHIFLPPNEIATYGILIPKGPFVTVSLVHPVAQMRSLVEFLATAEVASVLGRGPRRVCGCLPRISVGPAAGLVEDGLVAVGDASATRLYKNGIGSALATARRAAWTAVFRGTTRAAFNASYLPLCRSIELDNQLGRLLFLEVPMLKRFGVVPLVHYRVAAGIRRGHRASELQSRILWGMFTGAYSYTEIVRKVLSPRLLTELTFALGQAGLQRATGSLSSHRESHRQRAGNVGELSDSAPTARRSPSAPDRE